MPGHRIFRYMGNIVNNIKDRYFGVPLYFLWAPETTSEPVIGPCDTGHQVFLFWQLSIDMNIQCHLADVNLYVTLHVYQACIADVTILV